MLSLNADATGGEIRVALLDVNGQPVPGYALEDCTPITGDSVRHAVTWRERNEVPTGEDVRIRIVATNADLYSFQVQPKSTP
jgi:hypothetical protein